MPIQADKETRDGQRIAKVMARAGLCSRRDAEQWIAAGRVSVNGVALTSPAFNVAPGDDVRVDGAPLPALERTRLFLFHKPRGLVTTARDPEGRPTIFDALPEGLPRLVAVGRLDINTEGLLLLTNDGGLARVLELPATGWLRRYRVRAHGEIGQDQLDALRGGLTIDGVDYLGIEARFERQQGSNVWLTMGLREGKNREIKRVLEHLGLSVNRLIRISFGPFELADLAERAVIEAPTRVLRDQLGPRLAKQAHADFEAAASPPARVEPPTSGLRHGRRPEAAEPRRDAVPRKRKHVSVLRAEAREEGPRKRIDRLTTTDRRGREVKVERVSLARPIEEPREGRGPRRRGTNAPRGAPTRGADNGFGGARGRSARGIRDEKAKRFEGRREAPARPSRGRRDGAGAGFGEARPGGQTRETQGFHGGEKRFQGRREASARSSGERRGGAGKAFGDVGAGGQARDAQRGRGASAPRPPRKFEGPASRGEGRPPPKRPPRGAGPRRPRG